MKQNRGSRGSTQGPPETQTSKRKTQQSTTGQKDPAATRRGRRAGRGGQGGEGCTNHIRIAIVQLSGV